MTYIDIDGKQVPLNKLPCWKCKDRYSIHCPTCAWNKDGKYNTYGGTVMNEPQFNPVNRDPFNDHLTVKNWYFTISSSSVVYDLNNPERMGTLVNFEPVSVHFKVAIDPYEASRVGPCRNLTEAEFDRAVAALKEEYFRKPCETMKF